MSRISLFFALLAAVSIYATVKGGAPERRATLILILGIIMTIILASPSDDRFSQAELGILMTDLAVLAAFLRLALDAERYWTLWICAMQMIQVLSHIPVMFLPELLPQAYHIITAFWVYPMLIVLTIGTYRHQQRLQQFGVDRSWSDFSTSPK